MWSGEETKYDVPVDVSKSSTWKKSAFREEDKWKTIISEVRLKDLFRT